MGLSTCYPFENTLPSCVYVQNAWAQCDVLITYHGVQVSGLTPANLEPRVTKEVFLLRVRRSLSSKCFNREATFCYMKKADRVRKSGVHHGELSSQESAYSSSLTY